MTSVGTDVSAEDRQWDAMLQALLGHARYITRAEDPVYSENEDAIIERFEALKVGLRRLQFEIQVMPWIQLVISSIIQEAHLEWEFGKILWRIDIVLNSSSNFVVHKSRYGRGGWGVVEQNIYDDVDTVLRKLGSLIIEQISLHRNSRPSSFIN